MNVIKLMVFYILGLFILPIILLFTNKKIDRLKFLNNIYGNDVDGLGGDFGTNPSIIMPSNIFTRMFPRYYWLAIRNPTHNLGLSMGAHGTIKDLWRNKKRRT